MEAILHYLPVLLGGVLTTVAGWLVRKTNETAKTQREAIKAQQAENAAVKESIVAILRFHLMAMFKNAENQGYISTEELEVFEGLFVPYKTLGGDGIIDAYHNKLLKFPTRPMQEEQRP